MPIARVQTPEGIARLEVPEGTTAAQIEQFVASQFPQEATQETQIPEPQESLGRTVLEQGMQGATFGFADEIADPLGVSIAALLTDPKGFISGEITDPALAEQVAKARQTTQERLQRQFEQRPIVSTGAQLAGAVGTGGAAATTKAGTAIGRGLRAGNLGARTLKGAGAGGASGATFGAGAAEDEAKTEGARRGAVLGATLGTAYPLAGASVSSILGRSKGAVADLFEDIGERGLDGTQAFSEVQTLLGDEAANLSRRISTTFDDAVERGANTEISKDVISELSEELSREAAQQIDDRAASVLQNSAQRLDDLLTKDSITLNDLQSLRRIGSQTSARGGSEGFAGGVVKDSIDGALDNAFEAGKISGDKEAVQTWKRAIDLRKQFGNKFERAREVAFAVGNETIESVEQKFIGGASPSQAKNAARIYDDVLKALPEGQKEQGGFLLRQSIVNKMIKNAAKRSDDPEGVSATFLANQIKNLRRDNPSLWNKFPDDEKRILNKLQKDLLKQSEGGPLNKIGGALFNLLGRATRSNLELPRTLRPKTIVDIKELLDLTRVTPVPRESARVPALENIQSFAAPQAAGVGAAVPVGR